MGQIIRPFQNLLAPGNLQIPTGQLAIDWTHSLANGLVGCWMPAYQGGLVDITRTWGATTWSGPVAPALTQEGPAVDGTAAIGAGNPTGVPPPPVALTGWKGGFTLYWRGYQVNVTATNFNSNPVYLAITYATPNASPFWVIGMLGTNNAGTADIFLVFGSSINYGNALTVGLNDMVTTWNLGNSLVTPYLNGVAGAAQAFQNTIPPNGGGGFAAFGQCQAYHNMACMWNRVLRVDEIARLRTDPYSFLIPAEYELPALPLAASTKFRKTFSHIGGRVGSRQPIGW